VEARSADYVVLIVADLDRSLAFYVDLLGLPPGHRSGPFAQLATGTARVSLYQRDAMAETLGRSLRPPDPDAPGFELGFLVDDCDRAYHEVVNAGAKPAVPPADRPWGQRTAYVRDPDGHLVELAQDIRNRSEPGQSE
jgi:lactoylglutathione lyase